MRELTNWVDSQVAPDAPPLVLADLNVPLLSDHYGLRSDLVFE